ncbi:unnamed protein product [Orchesella dallaii]|uniref:Odorant receptor n=1 Tax=Orchesella dallaii TaxID=48710 RepID=A0ABP1S3W1_9HEXA
MLSEKILNSYQKAFSLASTIPGFPIEYDEKSGKLGCNNNKKTLIFTSVYQATLAALLFVSAFFTQTNETIITKIVEVFWSVGLMFGVHSNWTSVNQCQEIVKLFNNFVVVESQRRHEGVVFHEDQNFRNIISSCKWVLKILPVASVLWSIGTMLMPCQPFNMLYIVTPSPLCSLAWSDWGTIWKIGGRMLLGLATHFTVYSTCIPATLLTTQITFGAMCIRSEIMVFGNEMERLEKEERGINLRQPKQQIWHYQIRSQVTAYFSENISNHFVC